MGTAQVGTIHDDVDHSREAGSGSDDFQHEHFLLRYELYKLRESSYTCRKYVDIQLIAEILYIFYILMQYQLWLPIPILTPIHLGDQNRVFVHPTILTRGSSQSTLPFLFY